MPAQIPITVRPATAGDLPALIALEKDSLTAAHWSEKEYSRACAANDPVILVAESKDRSRMLIGFIFARIIGDNWELENIVIAKAAQGQGIGSQLLGDFLDIARQKSAQNIFLEVRASNLTAILLYKRFGFEQDAVRKLYYSNPEEDAFLFHLSLRDAT